MTEVRTVETPRLVSIQVGMPRVFSGEGVADARGRPWASGIVKGPVEGPVWLGRTNLAGDGQGDTENHGGPEQAVLAYAAAHYPLWREEWQQPDLPYGAFGENFTLDGLSEDTACIGDTLVLGEARVQVSSPRMPCWKLERRLGREGAVARVTETGRSGWYLRVLVEGHVEAGMSVVLLDRPHPEWTVAAAARAMRQRAQDPGAAARLAACPLLSSRWRGMLAAAAR